MVHRRDSVCERVKVIRASSFVYACVHLSMCVCSLSRSVNNLCVCLCMCICVLKFALGSTGD